MYFLFRKENISQASQYSSDTGEALSVASFPAESLSYSSAVYGGIYLFFSDSGVYDNTFMTSGEGMERSYVFIPAEYGLEFDVLTRVLNTVKNSKSQVIAFDFVNRESNIEGVDFSRGMDIQVKVNPVNRVTGGVSKTPVTITTDTVEIAGIDFGTTDHLPEVDYNEDQLSTYNNGDTVTAWNNDPDATGGSKYNISTIVGTPACSTSSDRFASGTKVVFFGSNEYFDALTISAERDYTLYFVASSSKFGLTKLFGDSSGNSEGASLRTDYQSNIMLRHIVDGTYSSQVSVYTNNEDNNTTNYSFPSQLSSADQNQVIVIRRDKDYNITVYNNNGDRVGFIPANEPSLPSSAPGRTDGELSIEQIGTSESDTTTASFNGDLARFGLIQKDIGDANARDIARQLNERYKP